MGRKEPLPVDPNIIKPDPPPAPLPVQKDGRTTTYYERAKKLLEDKTGQVLQACKDGSVLDILKGLLVEHEELRKSLRTEYRRHYRRYRI